MPTTNFKIHHARLKKQGWTNRKIATACGINDRQLYRILSGERNASKSVELLIETIGGGTSHE